MHFPSEGTRLSYLCHTLVIPLKSLAMHETKISVHLMKSSHNHILQVRKIRKTRALGFLKRGSCVWARGYARVLARGYAQVRFYSGL